MGFKRILEIITEAIISTLVLAIPFCIYMRYLYLQEKKIDEFIKKYYRL